uniref:rab11 family-interacting protein 1-like n=1 Tax=Oncorhynchus gorbuscha TaxID=8017 RepID=UPI001EAF7F34|nr:rab11 family-interacting protein 1-like [Oncorhynchus gorbuscha]
MSLSDQSQQWYPTSVQVTVLQARSLRIKGKNGTNDAYAIMQVAKDKFATSVAEKSVAPVWKEEATFELPLFHNGNTEKCTLHVHVMHRALVGSDKLLGHAVINLLELSEVKSRNKTEWHKLLDKAGKPDKDRGEVLVDVQFMKNNLTASMFDLSATDKPRSRLGKFKDKVRGKKKEGLSDSASAVVPSFTQVLTDSEGEGEGEGGADKEDKKKKNKLKSLFSPKSNLQRHGLSQSMSVLGPLPEKDSSLSGSPSGLNEDSSEGKNKFKFLTHKRTGSSDSKASQGSLSLGRSKIHAPLAEQSNLCINGSHLYTEHPHPRSARTGSTFSLASSGHGSMEDLRRAQGRKSSSTSMDSLTALKQPSPWAEGESSRAEEDEEEERVKMDEMKRKDDQERKKLEEERMRKEEKEKRRIGKEVERLRFEEEEKTRKEEQENRKRMEEEEKIRVEEESRMLEERKRRLKEEGEERVKKKEQEMIRLQEEQERWEEEERIRKEEEERKIREEEERIRKFEEEMLRKEEAETMRLEEERGNEQERSDKEQKERFRVEEENIKTEELRQEEKRRNAQMEEEQRREEARAPLEEVEKQMEQYSEAKVTVCNNPFEEVSPTSSFDDSSSNNLFEENPMTTTGPISCRINKVSAVKPRPSSWGNPSKPAISSNPFLSSSSPELESSMDSPRGARENRDAIDPSANLMEKKDPAPVAPINQPWARKDNWSSKSHCATPTLAKTKPTKPPPPLRCQSSTALVGSGDDQGSVSGKDHSSVRQEKGPAPLPPDNQRWAHKDNWPSKSNPGSATPTLTQKTPTKPQPPPRRHSATSLVGSEHDLHLNESVSQDDSGVRRDKRPAPLPPDRPNQAPSQIQRDQSMASVNRGHKDRVDASMSKVSQRVVQMITPLRSSSTAPTEHISGGQSSTHHGNQAEEPLPSATGGLVVAKHNKGPAPSRPQHLPGKTMPTPTVDVLDEQSNTEEHDSSVEFGPNNPFAEDCRMEKSSGCGVEQSLTGERQGSPDSHNQQSCTSTDADLGPFQKRVVGDTTELPTPDALPAEDVSCPTKSTSAKRARAPLPPVKTTSTFREEGAGKQSSGKLQSPGAPTSSKLSSGNWVKKQNGGVGVALPCVTLAQPPCFPSPAPSSIPHPEPLKGSGGRRDCPPQTTSSVPGQKTLLHAGALPSITEQNSGEEAGGRGDRSASSTRRPHPVKPLSSLENQPASNIHEGQAGKSTGILGGLQEKIKVKDTGVKGPYSQLTQEELISLVLKQQEQLSKRDDKIKELEQYIDNLLVRIIEEQPSILMTMNSLK